MKYLMEDLISALISSEYNSTILTQIWYVDRICVLFGAYFQFSMSLLSRLRQSNTFVTSRTPDSKIGWKIGRWFFRCKYVRIYFFYTYFHILFFCYVVSTIRAHFVSDALRAALTVLAITGATRTILTLYLLR